MNKSEKLICVLLGTVLAWYVFSNFRAQSEAAAGAEGGAATAPAVSAPATPAPAPAAPTPVPAVSAPVVAAPELPSVPEQVVTLENAQLKLELSSWGGVVRKAVLKEYACNSGPIGEANPAVELNFALRPLGMLSGVPGMAPTAAFEVAAASSNSVEFVNAVMTRKVTLGENFQIVYEDALKDGTPLEGARSLSLGVMRIGSSKNDVLSVDSCLVANGKGKEEVIHHADADSPLKSYLVGGLGGGCSGCGGSQSAAGMPATSGAISYPGAQKWIALKNRFFVSALVGCDQPNGGFVSEVRRDLASANYRPETVAASVTFAQGARTRRSVFFVGPKKQSLLWDIGMKDVMEFGMWRWICYPLVWVLNLFNGWIPSYGVAIILLTVLVRLIFWPLTHKSTVGMKKMQEIQPLMKEIQQKYKDNPQRLQQETWALYKEKQVNPMSSCLPMLIQIPVFIALFNVLRSAVELRYAPFLWIADLSEPEALGANSWFPFFGGLNLLPIAMAATMALQSALTPSSGDRSQQRMMMVFMPLMMLFMFYSFPSALSLYWTLSQVLSIWQMWLIRRQGERKNAADKVIVPEVIDPPQTRQMRRHG